MTLTYDMTFLILVLTSLYEIEPTKEEHHCLVHPMKKHPMLWNEISEYAADMNIALSYHHFVDDWQDEHSLSGYAGKVAMKKKYQKIEAKYQRQCNVIERCLTHLRELEKHQEQNLDEVARCFGELMSEIFVYKEDEWEEDLRNLGFYLGKFIYLIDAYEDLEKDLQSGSYNPFRYYYEQEDYEQMCQQLLTMMIAESAKALEHLPLIHEVDIIRNVVYAGVWVKYDTLRKKKQDMRKE